METRLFNSSKDGSTYLLSKHVNNCGEGSLSLRRVNSDGSVSEPLINKNYFNGPGAKCIKRTYANGSSKIRNYPTASFSISEGDSFAMSGKMRKGNIILENLDVKLDKSNLDGLSPMAKRFVRKLGEAFAKIR